MLEWNTLAGAVHMVISIVVRQNGLADQYGQENISYYFFLFVGIFCKTHQHFQSHVSYRTSYSHTEVQGPTTLATPET